MSPFNILFTSAGRRVSLIQHFKKTLESLGLQGKIITTDLKKNAPAAFVGDIHEIGPRVTDPEYISFLLDLCSRHGVKLLIPLIDTELPTLARSRDKIEASGVKVLISSAEAIEISRNKINTYQFFKKMNIDTPEIFDPTQILEHKQGKFPFLIKPADGSSSIGITKVNTPEELAFFIKYTPNAIVQEYIQGEEYTLDVLVDFHGNVRSVVPRYRMETRAGEVSKGMTVKNPKIISAGKAVAEKLPGALGCITIQCFLTPDGALKFIEINPRFGGGHPLAIEAGADFPRWVIEMVLGRTVEVNIDDWEDGVVMLRFDDAVFAKKSQVL